MGMVERIMQDLSDEQITERIAAHERWLYGTGNLQAARAEELHLYPSEVGVRCAGCGKTVHMAYASMCQECGEEVCDRCPGTCPHKEG